MIFPDRDLKLVPYKDICDALCKRYDQCESILRRRYKFYRREQGSSESAEDFIRAVKQLAERCDFGGFKSEAIRDRLVFGINDRDLQKRLMDKGDLTLRETEQLMLNDDILGSRSGQLSPVSSLDDHDVGSFGGSASKQSNSAVMKSVKRSRSPSVLRAGSVDRRKSMAPRAPQMKKDTFDYYDRYDDPRDLFERRYGIRGRDFPPLRSREPMPPIPPLMRRSAVESSRSSQYDSIFSRRTPPPPSRNGSSISRFGVYEDFSRDSFDDRRQGLRGPSPTHRYAPY
nr:uncharacterized protein LOC115264690 isoform X2 [Aedes albopictus]